MAKNYPNELKRREEYYKTVFHLKEFEKKLHEHVHLENNILFESIRTLLKGKI